MPRLPLPAVVVPLVTFGVLAALVLARPGFTPDEEITAVTASAVSATGLPLLPSGVLYPRGIPYVYAAFLTALLLGPGVLAGRLVSAAAAGLGIVAAYRIGARLGGRTGGLLLSLLLATFPPFVAGAVFARPYAPLVTVALILIDRSLNAPPSGQHATRRWPFAALVVLATLLHPLGLVLAAWPAALAALREDAGEDAGEGDRGGDRALWPAVRTSALAAGAALAASGLVYAAHLWSLRTAQMTATRDTAVYAVPTLPPPGAYAADLAGPPGWMIAAVLFALLGIVLDRRFPRARAVIAACAICAATDRLGFLLLVAFAAIVMEPRESRSWLVVSLTTLLAGIAFWTLHTAAATDAQLTFALARSLASAGAAFPLGHLRFALAAMPVLSALAVIGVVAAIVRPGTPGSACARAISLFAVGLPVAYAMFGVPITDRYLLLPWTLLVLLAGTGAAVLGELVGSGRREFAASDARRRTVARGTGAFRDAIVVAAVLALVLVGYGPYVRDKEGLAAVTPLEHALAPATGSSWTVEEVGAAVDPGDQVVCTEELACLHLLGRVDFLFALPPKDVAHYVVNRAGRAAGFYAGAPVVTSASDLAVAVDRHSAEGCTAVVALRSGKVGYDEYLAVLEGLRDRLDVRDVLSRDDVHVSRLCPLTVHARVTLRGVP
ncbi:MAG: glycosyltransferase family 39 protein [Vicinamibacterales bacterium]